MAESSPGENSNEWRVTRATYVTLAIVLIGYPLLRMNISIGDFSAGGDDWWWTLWAVILVGHWICVVLVIAAIVSERGSFASIGLDTRLIRPASLRLYCCDSRTVPGGYRLAGLLLRRRTARLNAQSSARSGYDRPAFVLDCDRANRRVCRRSRISRICADTLVAPS